jgi:hypothetical protein
MNRSHIYLTSVLLASTCMVAPLEAQISTGLVTETTQETESSLLVLVKKHITGGKVKQIEAGLKALINDAAFKALPVEAKSQVMNVLVQERIQQIAPKALTYSVVKEAIAAAQVKANVSPVVVTPPSAQAPNISAPTSPVLTPASPAAKAPIAAAPGETPSKAAPAPRAEAPSVGTSPDAIGSRRQIGAPKPSHEAEHTVVAPTIQTIAPSKNDDKNGTAAKTSESSSIGLAAPVLGASKSIGPTISANPIKPSGKKTKKASKAKGTPRTLDAFEKKLTAIFNDIDSNLVLSDTERLAKIGAARRTLQEDFFPTTPAAHTYAEELLNKAVAQSVTHLKSHTALFSATATITTAGPRIAMPAAPAAPAVPTGSATGSTDAEREAFYNLVNPAALETSPALSTTTTSSSASTATTTTTPAAAATVPTTGSTTTPTSSTAGTGTPPLTTTSSTTTSSLPSSAPPSTVTPAVTPLAPSTPTTSTGTTPTTTTTPTTAPAPATAPLPPPGIVSYTATITPYARVKADNDAISIKTNYNLITANKVQLDLLVREVITIQSEIDSPAKYEKLKAIKTLMKANDGSKSAINHLKSLKADRNLTGTLANASEISFYKILTNGGNYGTPGWRNQLPKVKGIDKSIKDLEAKTDIDTYIKSIPEQAKLSHQAVIDHLITVNTVHAAAAEHLKHLNKTTHKTLIDKVTPLHEAIGKTLEFKPNLSSKKSDQKKELMNHISEVDNHIKALNQIHTEHDLSNIAKGPPTHGLHGLANQHEHLMTALTTHRDLVQHHITEHAPHVPTP